MGVRLGSAPWSLSKAPEIHGAGQGGTGAGLEQGSSAPRVDGGVLGLEQRTGGDNFWLEERWQDNLKAFNL